jgi:2-polyprenyl-6-methoxyphenol hydroxylase-like FAD-dependent oxidoreductase
MVGQITTDIMIIGGGPVGMTLAIDLTRRGVGVTLAEVRVPGEAPSVRCDHVSARTMETFRRIGLASVVRGAGLPADYPNDVAFRTTATGLEFGRIPIPCSAERYTAKGGPDTCWPTPEPPHRINQIYLEPVLLAHAAAMPKLRILRSTRVSEFEQKENGVLAIARNLDTGETLVISARYLIGCDGAYAETRRMIGARLSGDAAVAQTQSTHIRAPKLLGMMPGPAWAVECINPRTRGLMFAIDGREQWLVHDFLAPGECLSEADLDRRIREILGVGPSFGFAILGWGYWTGRRMVADRFRDRRVFLCGDAAHIWASPASYGMNAGIADAMSLSWMLAGVIKGWADPALLDAYEIERRPITEQMSRYEMDALLAQTTQRSTIPDTIEQAGLKGDAARAFIGRQTYDINVSRFCCGGFNFGYSYAASPIIAYDGESAPAYTMYDFSQSTVPGCRTPHLWLRDGRSLYDAVACDFTLLRFDSRIEVGRLVAAAADREVPMAVFDVDADEAAALYPCKLLLSRPDLHVAWRGDRQPANPMALIDRVRGVYAGA